MNRTCPIVIDQCECIDPPVLNISSEAPDPLIFTGVGYSPYDPYAPPPLGDTTQYTAYDCFGVAYSVESQELANLLAKMNSIICQQYKNGAGSGNGWLYSNDRQTAYLVCSSNTTFWYAVPAGTYVATFSNPASGVAWLAAANAAALAYAKQQVEKLYTCIGSPQIAGTNYPMCLGETLVDSGPLTDFVYSLSGKNSGAEYTFEVVSGTLPTGVTLVQNETNSAALSGTPTVLGTYQFTVRATMVSNASIYAEIVSTIDVSGISNATLPGATVGDAYSEQLSVTGGVSPYTFEITDGSLPGGLSMDSSGLITGTPTTAGSSSFSVLTKDSSTFECTQTVTLDVVGCPADCDGLPCQLADVTWEQVGSWPTSVFTATDGAHIQNTMDLFLGDHVDVFWWGRWCNTSSSPVTLRVAQHIWGTIASPGPTAAGVIFYAGGYLPADPYNLNPAYGGFAHGCCALGQTERYATDDIPVPAGAHVNMVVESFYNPGADQSVGWELTLSIV